MCDQFSPLLILQTCISEISNCLAICFRGRSLFSNNFICITCVEVNFIALCLFFLVCFLHLFSAITCGLFSCGFLFVCGVVHCNLFTWLLSLSNSKCPTTVSSFCWCRKKVSSNQSVY